MSAERKTYLHQRSAVSYLRFGRGATPVVCFHGYGEEAENFTFLEKYAGNQFTFLALDLPFHGQTDWQDGLPISVVELLSIVQGILAENGFAAGSRFLLTGFSLGGRICLSLYEKAPELVEKMVLMAPDGLKVNFWYWLATQTRAGNRFFRFTMRKPGWFFGLLKGLNKLGLVNASIFKFVKHYIGDKEVRRLLYIRWTALCKLKPHLPMIKKEIRQQQTPVRLLYGRHDRIILSSVGEKFRKGIEEQCSITILHSGHQVLHEKHVQEILPALLPSPQ